MILLQLKETEPRMTGTKQTSKGNRTLAWEEQSIPEPNTNRITVLLQLKEPELHHDRNKANTYRKWNPGTGERNTRPTPATRHSCDLRPCHNLGSGDSSVVRAPDS